MINSLKQTKHVTQNYRRNGIENNGSPDIGKIQGTQERSENPENYFGQILILSNFMILISSYKVLH